MTYVNFPYDKMTAEQHVHYLKKLLGSCLKYIDGESFKAVLLGQQDNYMLELINELKKEGIF